MGPGWVGPSSAHHSSARLGTEREGEREREGPKWMDKSDNARQQEASDLSEIRNSLEILKYVHRVEKSYLTPIKSKSIV